MDILILTNKMPYPPKDGGAIATLSMARSFADLGHKVTILAMNTSKHYFDLSLIPEDVSKKTEFLGVDVDTKISASNALKNFFASSIPYNAQRFITGRYDQSIAELLAKRRFDVIQLEGIYVGPYIRTIRKHSKALISMRAHNVEHEIWQRTAALSWGIKAFYLTNLAKRLKRFETAMLNNYDVLVPITERDADQFVKLGCKIPVHVAPTGIESAKFKPDYDNIDFPSLFHLGALDWSPNQEGLKWFFAKVWPKILKDFPALKFYLAGRNASPYFRKLSEPNVEFLGEVDDAHAFMKSKAIMIVPLLSGSGMRIKIIEGMALGKAIVSTSIGIEGIHGTHQENVMVADNPDAFAESVAYLLKNKTRVIAMGRNAKEFAGKHYNNLEIVKSLIAFYTQHIS
jgi:polysaccharide biosynthesis protein PslH